MTLPPLTFAPLTVVDVERPRYGEGQFLSAADFRAEQDYHRRALARHQLGGHTWGIVVGLELIESPDPVDGSLVDVHLTPGLAIDGYGRQVVSFGRVALDPGLFDAFTTDAHRTVWIEFDEVTARPAPDGYEDCSPGRFTRTVETFRLVVDPVSTRADVVVEGLLAAPPPAPAGTPEIPADTSVPYQEPPVEPPLVRWLVRLGTVRWDGGARRFRPAAPGRLAEQRRYVGAVAADVLAPADTLRLARRTPTTPDDAEFATVEGRLRVEGRLTAEREVRVFGGPVRFTDPGGEEQNTPITLTRHDGPGTEHRLRVRLGDAASATTALTVGTGGAATVAEVRADGRVLIPLGPLDLGTDHRQGVDLHGPGYGIGTQPGLLYLRSPSRFAWYTGGTHDDAAGAPGAGGSVRLELDSEAALDFGARTHQMLKLWSDARGPMYGIGVQSHTLYFRTDHDVAWFRRGVHVDDRGKAGDGGTVMMTLDSSSTLNVFGQAKTSGNLTVGAGGDAAVVTRHVRGKSWNSDAGDHLYLNWNTGLDVVVGASNNHSALEVNGRLRVRATGQSAVDTVVKVVRTDLVVTNQFNGLAGSPGNWSWNWGNALDEVFTVFVVVNGFTLTDDLFDATPTRTASDSVIPQNVWARVSSFTDAGANGQAFCSQSDAGAEANNKTAITVVAIGRKWS